MNLKDTYTEIFNNTDLWKYYENMHVDTIIWGEDSSCKNFITNYFDNGCKKSIFKLLDDFDCEIKGNRFVHMVSTYFLGILLSDVFFTKDEKHCLENQNSDFRWIWFILCLYHDIGYIFEQNGNKFENIHSYTKFIKYKKFDIKHLYYKSVKPKFYSKTLVHNYFNYRIKEKKKLEHGIIGGIFLFDRLCKNYHSAKDSSGSTNTNFEFSGLSWSEGDLVIFANLADIISAHNIWRIKSNDKNVDQYKKYKLSKLIDTKVDYKEDLYIKLFYLLSICDTIEPTKTYALKGPIELLENISISISEKRITLSVLDENFNYSALFEKVSDLQNWLKLIVEPSNNKLTITL